MRPMPLDGQMMRLKRLAQVREEKLRNQASGDPAGLPDEAEEDAGVAVNEHADTWGFSWMPAIEDFVEQAAKAEHRGEEESDPTDDFDDRGGEAEPRARARPAGRRSRSGSPDPDDRSGVGVGGGGGELVPGSSAGGSGRKRRRPRASGWSSSSSSPPPPPPSSLSRRRAPRPPSYNETLLADKSFHNPHASETMADAFGILRPASFVLDVEDDDRPWGGGADAVAAAKGAAANGDGAGGADGGGSGGGGGAAGEDDRNWFYDTVRDRQNRLWADTRVRKGVELARKGQHQAAIDVYTQALGMCPDHDDGLVARGAAFATTGRLRQAGQDLSQALSLNPNNDNASRYLKETRRRMERQDTRSSPGSAAGPMSNASRLDHRAGPNVTDRLELGGPPAGNAERDEASRAALGALLQDGAEADALRRMRALLEEDQRKRKRGGGGGGGGGEGEGRDGGDVGAGGSSSSRKKKSRKKDKKSSSSKSKRSSSSRHKKRDRRRESGAGEARYDSSSSSSGGGGGGGSSDAGDNSSTDARSSSSKKKKKKKHKHKHKKRSSAGPRNEPGGRGGLSGTVSANLYARGGEESGDDAHPILQRKKHSLWG